MRIPLFAIALILAALLVTGGHPRVVSASQSSLVVGDADCNSSVTPLDTLAVLEHSADAETDADCVQLADVNCDGNVDVQDAAILLRYSASVELQGVPQNCAAIGSLAGLPGLTVAVDGSIDVPDGIPGIDGQGPARPLAVLKDDSGKETPFVENELVLVTDDQQVVDGFLARWNGTVVKTIDPHAFGVNSPKIYLIHIDPSGMDTSNIAQDLRKVNATAFGAFSVSSTEGADLLAVAAQEAGDGTPLDINWVTTTNTYDQRALHDAASGPSGWSSNPYDWNYMNQGSEIDTGVGDAWRALNAADKLGNKVTISILDGGFVPNADFPSDLAIHGSTNVPNPATCTGGSACPWHGTVVTAAAMGVPNNDFGVAGPGGPVAKAIITQSPSSDVMSYLEYIFLNLPATALGAPDIINMSAGVSVASEWCLTGFCSALDGIMIGVRHLGMLVFAAAGNDNANVDDVKCVDAVVHTFCYESHVEIPCEVDDVICVGALGDNSHKKASYSNYGFNQDNTVDIYAPSYQFQTPTPDSAIKYGACGTSCASPFAAGVAALIEAADPSLGPGDVEGVLLGNAHRDVHDCCVNRWVDAYQSVISALGGNQPPELLITFSGPTINGGTPLHVESLVSDPEDRPTLADPYNGLPTVVWTDSLDGVIGSGDALDNVLFSYGSHTLTAVATDSAGSHVSDQVSFTIVNVAPTVSITQPADGASYYTGQAVRLKATSIDPNYVDGKLPDSALTWYLTAPNSLGDRSNPVANGDDVVINMPAQGDYGLVLVGKDDQNATDDASVIIHVGPVPVDLPPNAVVDNVDYTRTCDPNYYEFIFNGHATDPEQGSLTGSSLVWTKTPNGGGATTVLGTGQSLHVSDATIDIGDWIITLTATDSSNGHGTDSVELQWSGCVS
ncbi:MAG: S8 family serine peptidase [Chloroflexota bacterium]